LGAVGRQQERDRLTDVVVDPASLLHCPFDGGEVVVGQHDIGGLLGRLGALDAHRDPDICTRDGRRVVDTVAGHRDDFALRLECPHDAQLVLRRGARVDVDITGHQRQLVLTHRVQVGPGQRLHSAVRPHDAEFAGDGHRSALVVAGDHLHPDARGVGVGDRVGDLRARWIDDADQPQEGQVSVQIGQLDGFHTVGGTLGHRENPQTLYRQLIDMSFPGLDIHRHPLTGGGQLAGRAVEQPVRCSERVNDPPGSIAVGNVIECC